MNVGFESSVVAAVPARMDVVGAPGDQNASSVSSFSDVLKGAIGSVSDLQNSADQQVSTLLQSGQGDMSKTMISVEKADVAFQLMLQVRNKVVSAYQDIEKMQF